MLLTGQFWNVLLFHKDISIPQSHFFNDDRLLRVALLRLSRYIYFDCGEPNVTTRAAGLMSPELTRHLESLKREASQLNSPVSLKATSDLVVLLTTMESSFEDTSHQLAFECLAITRNFVK